jgi:hypothetical protein
MNYGNALTRRPNIPFAFAEQDVFAEQQIVRKIVCRRPALC